MKETKLISYTVVMAILLLAVSLNLDLWAQERWDIKRDESKWVPSRRIVPPTATPPITPLLQSRNLEIGMSGVDVERLNQALMQLGFSIPKGLPNYFSRQTQKAVFTLQKQYGLNLTGIVDGVTANLIEKLLPK